MKVKDLIETLATYPDDCHVMINTNNNPKQDIRYEETVTLTDVDSLFTDCALLIVLSGKEKWND